MCELFLLIRHNSMLYYEHFQYLLLLHLLMMMGLLIFIKHSKNEHKYKNCITKLVDNNKLIKNTINTSCWW